MTLRWKIPKKKVLVVVNDGDGMCMEGLENISYVRKVLEESK